MIETYFLIKKKLKKMVEIVSTSKY